MSVSTADSGASNSCCYTKISRSKSCSSISKQLFSHAWVIDMFTDQLAVAKCGEFMQSMKFLDDDPNLSFYMKAYLKGINSSNSSSISVSLEALNKYTMPQIEIAFYIITAGNKKVKKWATTGELRQPSMSFSCLTYIAHSDLLNDKHQYLPNNKLTILCEVVVSKAVCLLHIPDILLCDSTVEKPAFLEKLFLNPKHYDFTINVGDQSVRVHKAILAAQSPVFEAMFENNMVENQKNSVDINDIRYDAIKGMLEFIYTGKCSKMELLAAELLETADKYILPELKFMCETELCSVISVKNVSNMILLADRFNSERLKTACLNYVKVHIKDVLQSDEWKAANLCADLLQDILRFCAD